MGRKPCSTRPEQAAAGVDRRRSLTNGSTKVARGENPYKPSSLLIVDDDDKLRTALVRAMSARGFLTREAPTGAEALSIAEREPLDSAIIDLRLPDMNGLDVLRGLIAYSPKARIVVLTGYGSIATALEAMRFGACDYLAKPVDADDLSRALTGVCCLGDRSHEVPSLARVEWEHINRILMDCDGNVSAAARLLGIHRRSLQRKLSKYPTCR